MTVYIRRVLRMLGIGLSIFMILYVVYLIRLRGLDVRYSWRSQQGMWCSMDVAGVKINNLEIILRRFPKTRQCL